MSKYTWPGVVVVLAIGVSALAWYLSRPAKDDLSNGPSVAVRLPASFSGRAIRGKVHFDENCAACHGENAAGTGNGPPLVHNIYEPGHHADAAFQLAATRGTRSHHWNFGDMPPVAGIEAEEVSFIVAYVRELQRANGIE